MPSQSNITTPPSKQGSGRINLGATHTAGKLYAMMFAEADQAPDFHPDRHGNGRNHVARLHYVIGKRATANGITPEQFKQLVGWR